MSAQEAIAPAEESEAAKRPTSVLFVCGKNSIRSPIAELLARKLLPPNMYIASAGVQRGERDPFVDAVLNEEGLSLDARQPRGLEELADGYFDLIITLTPLAHHTVLERMRGFSVDVEYWPTPDPTLMTGSREQIMNAYRDVRDRLKRQITQRLAPN
ncbi:MULTISPECIES: low molecular weight phosphatase family protein [Ochrobactrum]|jgi:protein-tyrosine-phosphatase|uniref:Low molecular weight phosphatase family protein n=2 Tax=Ochrobactrum quorumnocens TaxID=271865 RepID=A0A248UJG2_9HYPH|nr:MULTISPECIES: low molecular weight phosphatase family protein [Brucella/Ochrobactrum group]MBD7992999.1 low molecular weight phosphatase family protein [Ochrobactrum gallinarum]ASV86818.1 low molecular weight phosphotyrosine phosphatase family protein [[Ochrobactrum] quorumnocens]KAA9361848.1 low molecular weight phosphatase family protein [[Ochrobactrum] quorumnocens]MCV9906528.1 low molecular weight phosphatase family protein [Brucella sp. HL-2]MDH7789879.1 protein-tyrosine-phosphatase [O